MFVNLSRFITPKNINEMLIRNSTESDLNVILSLRDAAREIMRANGNLSQWPDGVPAASTFLNDIKAGVSYIVEVDGMPVATFALIPGPDPTYNVVYDGAGWRRKSDDYGVIHRLASNGKAHGVFGEVIRFACGKYDDIRIDTHADNVIMRRLLERNGFVPVGNILLSNGEPRIAFHWLRG